MSKPTVETIGAHVGETVDASIDRAAVERAAVADHSELQPAGRIPADTAECAAATAEPPGSTAEQANEAVLCSGAPGEDLSVPNDNTAGDDHFDATLLLAASTELLEQQSALTDRFDVVVGDWERCRTGQLLERIESQLTALLARSGPATVHDPSATTCSSSPANRNEPQTDSVSAPTTLPDSLSVTSNEKTQSKPQPPQSRSPIGDWEAIKAAFLSEGPPPTSSRDQEVEVPQPASARVEHNEPVETIAEAMPDIMCAPPIVDVEVDDVRQLHEAIIARDDYTAWLLSRLRAIERQPVVTLSELKRICDVPEQLERRVSEAQAALVEVTRLAEVELSLERARLARETARLREREQELTRRARVLGIASQQEQNALEAAASSLATDETRTTRWLRLLKLASKKSPNA